MPRKRRNRANWPYRFAWLAFLTTIALYIAVQTLVGGATFAQRSYGTDWQLALIAGCLDATFAVWFFAVGASIGSFLNVVAFRLPLGRHIGGHSGCFYCQTPIRGADNVPVLAWIKLRGRCRTCRLPISIQYPLVELGVGLAFLFVYVSEISTGGGNLPGGDSIPVSGSLLRMKLSSTLVMRTLAYLFALSGLIAAALIAVRRQRVPLKLFAWSLTPWLISILVNPDLTIVRWRQALPDGQLEARLDAFLSLVCGVVAGIAIARLLAPILYPDFDRRLISSDRASTQARQFLAAMAVAGGLVGWQNAVSMTWVIALCGILSIAGLRRFRSRAALGDMVVWLWLGMLIFRGCWSWLAELQILPDMLPTVMRQVAGALLLAPVAVVIRELSQPPAAPATEPMATEPAEPEPMEVWNPAAEVNSHHPNEPGQKAT